MFIAQKGLADVCLLLAYENLSHGCISSSSRFIASGIDVAAKLIVELKNNPQLLESQAHVSVTTDELFALAGKCWVIYAASPCIFHLSMLLHR